MTTSQLGVNQVIVPSTASVHGAFGLVTSDIVHEALSTRPMRHPADPAAVEALFGGLVDKTVAQLQREGFADEGITILRAIDMRYRRQVHIITVPIEMDSSWGRPVPITAAVLDATVDRFETLYKQKYGPESTFREAGIELVSFRVRASGLVRKPAFHIAELTDLDPSHAVVETRRAYVADTNEMADVTAYDFERLRPGNVVPGPAIIWTPITTVVLNSRQVATCDAWKNLSIRGANRGRAANGKDGRI